MFNSLSQLQLLNVALRVWLFLFTIIALGIEGNINSLGYSYSRVNLGIAATVIGLIFSVFVGIFLLFARSLYNIWILIAIDTVNFVLYLAAASSLADIVGICHFMGVDGKCGLFRAGIAFLFLSWFLLLALVALDYYQYYSEGRGGTGGNFDNKIRGIFRSDKKAPPPNNGLVDQLAVEEPSLGLRNPNIPGQNTVPNPEPAPATTTPAAPAAQA